MSQKYHYPDKSSVSSKMSSNVEFFTAGDKHFGGSSKVLKIGKTTYDMFHRREPLINAESGLRMEVNVNH